MKPGQSLLYSTTVLYDNALTCKKSEIGFFIICLIILIFLLQENYIQPSATLCAYKSRPCIATWTCNIC